MKLQLYVYDGRQERRYLSIACFTIKMIFVLLEEISYGYQSATGRNVTYVEVASTKTSRCSTTTRLVGGQRLTRLESLALPHQRRLPRQNLLVGLRVYPFISK